MRSANVEWCEAATHAFTVTPHIAEFWNCVSNVCFIVVGFASMRHNLRLRMPWAFVAADSMLMVVGLGSVIFHATQSWFGEILDELPMSILALFYFWCIKDLHWLTSKPYDSVSYGLMAIVCLFSWRSYIVLHDFKTFTDLFTLQVAIPSLISLNISDMPLLSPERSRFWLFLVTILTGKGLWSIERYLYSQGACPTSLASPAFWLHPLWHLFSALAHGAWMLYGSQMVLKLRKEKKVA
mmetsp:Transcript_1839/g.5410  ORF Transcript_1839/g.5410 Transcript_1839/m.5410 type:complete len:239 (-) Transcript_1839:91-807(-)